MGKAHAKAGNAPTELCSQLCKVESKSGWKEFQEEAIPRICIEGTPAAPGECSVVIHEMLLSTWCSCPSLVAMASFPGTPEPHHGVGEEPFQARLQCLSIHWDIVPLLPKLPISICLPDKPDSFLCGGSKFPNPPLARRTGPSWFIPASLVSVH